MHPRPVRSLAEPRPSTEAVAALAAVLLVIPFLLMRRRPALLLSGLWLGCGIGLDGCGPAEERAAA